MPKVRGIGRKHKAGTGGSTKLPAARVLSSTTAPSTSAPARRKKRESQEGPPIEPPYPEPSGMTALQTDVQVATITLEHATDELEATATRHDEHMKLSMATLTRFEKLRSKPDNRSASWTAGLEAQLADMEDQEKKFDDLRRAREVESQVAQIVLERTLKALKEGHAAARAHVIWKGAYRAYWVALREQKLQKEEAQTIDELLEDARQNRTFDDHMDRIREVLPPTHACIAPFGCLCTACETLRKKCQL